MTEPTSPSSSNESSDVLERLKAAAETPRPSSPDEPSASESSTAESPETDSPAASQQQAKRDRLTLRDKVNNWLDSLGSPDGEKLERSIAEAPARIRHRRERLRSEKEQRRLDEIRRQIDEERRVQLRAQLEADVSEVREILAIKEAERQAQQAEKDRLAAAQMLQAQQERETEALTIAARELDGTDYVPAANHRPMLQEAGEDLNDEQLLDRARALLPEWRRRDRIVEKAQVIETASRQAAEAERAAEDSADLLLDDVEDAPYVPPYVLPSQRSNPQARLSDGFRQVTVTLAWLLTVAAGLLGTGWVGDATALRELHEGHYSGGFSMLSMAVWAIAILPVIGLILGIYVVHQWLPSQRSAVRQRASGWHVANAMLAGSVWFLLVHVQDWGLEVLAAGVMAALLVRAVQAMNLHTARNRTERSLTDSMVGLFTGWAIVFAMTSVAVVLAAWAINLLWIPETLWALAALLIVTWVTSMLTMTERGRMSVALGVAWGLAAIIGARLFGDLFSTWVIITAGICAFIVILTTENRRYRIARAERHAREAAAEAEYW